MVPGSKFQVPNESGLFFLESETRNLELFSMNWWDRFEFWVFRRLGISPTELLLRFLIALLVLYVVWWAIKTQSEVPR